MKTTPLTDLHRELGARMTDFAGYEMPLTYSGLKEEHRSVRERAGLFDVSHMGEFIVRGPQALDLIQYVTSNDASKLAVGQAQYSCFPTPDGGIVDDLIVYRLPDNPGMSTESGSVYMLVVNAGNMLKDWNWLEAHNTFDAELIDISDQTALLAFQGPLAAEILQTLTEEKLDAIPYYHCRRNTVAGVPNVLISATGYTGSGGFELYLANKDAATLWGAIMRAGAVHNVLPTGLGARDTLRLEMGFALYGNDIDETTSPLEAGLAWITKLEKGDFIGRDFLVAQKEAGLKRRLVIFTVEGRRAPRHGFPLLAGEGGTAVGRVTSGTHSPTLDRAIGMGYVPWELRSPDSEVFVDFGRKSAPGRVVKGFRTV